MKTKLTMVTTVSLLVLLLTSMASAEPRKMNDAKMGKCAETSVKQQSCQSHGPVITENHESNKEIVIVEQKHDVPVIAVAIMAIAIAEMFNNKGCERGRPRIEHEPNCNKGDDKCKGKNDDKGCVKDDDNWKHGGNGHDKNYGKGNDDGHGYGKNHDKDYGKGNDNDHGYGKNDDKGKDNEKGNGHEKNDDCQNDRRNGDRNDNDRRDGNHRNRR